MSVRELLSRAQRSSDLRHYPEFCHVDVLAAAGMAATVNPAYLSLYRLKFADDKTQLDTCKSVFISWMHKALSRRGVEPGGASRIGVQALYHWLDSTCKTCNGQKYKVIDGTPSLSSTECPACLGTGHRPMEWRLGDLDAVRDVLERADAAIWTINRLIDERLM